MNTREEQIAEMAKDIYTTGVAIDGTDIAYGVFDNDDHFHRMANALYAAGYRKQSDTVSEFVRKLKSDFDNDKGNLYVISEERLNELAAEYGVGVEE